MNQDSKPATEESDGTKRLARPRRGRTVPWAALLGVACIATGTVIWANAAINIAWLKAESKRPAEQFVVVRPSRNHRQHNQYLPRNTTLWGPDILMHFGGPGPDKEGLSLRERAYQAYIPLAQKSVVAGAIVLALAYVLSSRARAAAGVVEGDGTREC